MSLRKVDGSGGDMNWRRGDVNWCRGDVDGRLRDVNAVNLRSATTISI